MLINVYFDLDCSSHEKSPRSGTRTVADSSDKPNVAFVRTIGPFGIRCYIELKWAEECFLLHVTLLYPYVELALNAKIHRFLCDYKEAF